MKISRQKLGVNLLRFGLSAVFLWFGFSQLFDSLNWVAIVPDWAVNLVHLPPAMIVLANGIFEVILGSLLAMGFYVRIIAFFLALHLVAITFDLGLVATSVRDFGLVIASFALALIYNPQNKENHSPDNIGNPNSQ